MQKDMHIVHSVQWEGTCGKPNTFCNKYTSIVRPIRMKLLTEIIIKVRLSLCMPQGDMAYHYSLFTWTVDRAE